MLESVLTSDEAASLKSAALLMSGEELAEVERLMAGEAANLLSEAEDDDRLTTKIQLDRERTEQSQAITLGFVVDPVRRESCRHNLRLYAWTYFEASCWRGFAPYQEEMLATFQEVLLHGGKKARAVRRGGLKSTLARIATAWAVDFGHRRFPVLVGATDDKANEHRDNFLDMLRASEKHTEDFPEWKPVMLKRANPKKMLRLGGELLVVTAKDERGTIVFPRIDFVRDRFGNAIECEASECRVSPYSMQSTDVSGLSFVNTSGEVVRPDALIFDDVQTPQSAQSFMMTSKRENSICTTFMGLAGLGETIAAIMVCTVREEDDLTMRFCDRKKHPDWDGQTFPILLVEPSSKEAKERWAEYGLKLRDGDTPEAGFASATAYYVEHRAEMDAGGIVAWEDDKEDNYVSALQWCMTMSILQPDYFRCELQQKGARPKGSAIQLEASQIVKRFSGVPRGIVPAWASYLTAFVDSSDHVLWFAVVAWKQDMTSQIVEWGTWPDQGRQQFYKSDLQRMLEHELPGASWEEAFVNAHNRLDDFLLGQDWPTEDGKTRQIDLLLKDWSDGGQKPRIESQIMASKFRSRIRPSKGFAPKPGKKPIHDYGDKQRDRDTKSFWVERRTEQPVHVQFDANIFKANVARRLQTIVGAPSAMMFPGDNESELMLLAEHLTAERALPIVYDGSPGIVYEAIPGRDNDWLDCIVGNAVAASMLGCSLAGEVQQKRAVRTFKLPVRV